MSNHFISVSVLLFTILSNPKSADGYISPVALIANASAMLGAMNYKLDFETNPNFLYSETNPLVYDFIIVGGGSAGSVISSRLSENPNFNVLLLEAGGDPLMTNSVPLLALYNTNHPVSDWMYDTVPQVNAALKSPNNQVRYARGKSLGGSSNLNFMIYMRGNPKDFDNWANLTGDSQWSYENVLPYFKKSENYQGNYPDPKYHSSSGPLTISAQNKQLLSAEWMGAAKELGFNNSDANADQEQTFYPLETTVKNGSRASTYEAYLKPALNRPNLFVIRYAHVIKINLDSKNRAVGVTYKRHGEIVTVRASKEVILSAGAIGSPQLLMISGIGHKEHLNLFGIETIVDLPGVGENLQDHVNTVFGPFLLNEKVSFQADRDVTLAVVTEYAVNKTGLFSYQWTSGIGIFSTNQDQWPNICGLQIPIGIPDGVDNDIENMFGLIPKTLTKYFDGFEGQDGNFVLVNIGLPKSRGNVKLQSTSPYVAPLIDPKYYSDPADIQAMISALKFFVKFYEETSTWKKFGAKLIPKSFPGCEKFRLKSEEYYECYARHFTGTTWHPCCTCSMGRDDDPMAVLDSNFRVRKTSNLRVVDASSMPVITNSNLNAPVIMLAEKAADIILKTWSMENSVT